MGSQHFKAGSINFGYAESTNCIFEITGILCAVDNEALPDITPGDNPFPYYSPIAVNTGYNLVYIQVPSTIIDVLQDTKTESLLDKLISVDGVVINSYNKGVNLTSGSIISYDKNILMASNFRLIGDLDDMMGGEEDELS